MSPLAVSGLHDNPVRSIVSETLTVCTQLFVRIHPTATERHLPYEITQRYLPPDTGEHAPARQAGTLFIYPGWMGG